MSCKTKYDNVLRPSINTVHTYIQILTYIPNRGAASISISFALSLCFTVSNFFFFTLIYFVIFVCACARQCAISFASRFICSFSSIRSVFVVLFIDIFIYKSRCLSHSSLTLFHSFTRDSLVTCGWFFSRTVLFLVFLSACNSWHFCLLLLWQHSQHINIVWNLICTRFWSFFWFFFYLSVQTEKKTHMWLYSMIALCLCIRARLDKLCWWHSDIVSAREMVI